MTKRFFWWFLFGLLVAVLLVLWHVMRTDWYKLKRRIRNAQAAYSADGTASVVDAGFRGVPS